jgi:hypothetical protein
VEIVLFLPMLIPFLFNCRGIVVFAEFHTSYLYICEWGCKSKKEKEGGKKQVAINNRGAGKRFPCTHE